MLVHITQTNANICKKSEYHGGLRENIKTAIPYISSTSDKIVNTRITLRFDLNLTIFVDIL